MHLDIELQRLDELRAKLGLPYQIQTPLPPMPAPKMLETIAKRLHEGIKTYSLENLERYGPYLTYCGVPAVIHLWNFDRLDLEQICERNFRNKRYHVVWCSVMDQIHRTNKFKGKLMYARRPDGTCRVEQTLAGKTISTFTEFPVCRSCLMTIGAMKFWTLPWVRSRLVKEFNLDQFLQVAELEMRRHPRQIVHAIAEEEED